MASLVNSTKYLNKNPSSKNFSPRNKEEETLPDSFFEASVSLIPKTKTLHDKKAIEWHP